MLDRQKKGSMKRSCLALIQRSFSNAYLAAHTSWALFGSCNVYGVAYVASPKSQIFALKN